MVKHIMEPYGQTSGKFISRQLAGGMPQPRQGRTEKRAVKKAARQQARNQLRQALVPSVRCACQYFTCSYCGCCHNPNCRHYADCTED